MHRREESCVIGSGTKNKGGVAEGIFYGLAHIVAGEVAGSNLGATFLFQHFCNLQCGLLCSSVYAGIGYKNAFGFGLILAPSVVEAYSLCQIFALERRTVQRSNSLDVECRCFLQHVLHLHSIFAHDVEVVASGLTRPVGKCSVGVILLVAECTKLSESVGSKQHLLLLFVTHEHLGPVHHWCGNELQSVLSQFQGIAFLHNKQSCA